MSLIYWGSFVWCSLITSYVSAGFETSVIYLRIVHAIVGNIYIISQSVTENDLEETKADLQKVKLPEMIPLATDTGKSVYASWVNGNWRMMNRGGGITSLNLEDQERIIKEVCIKQ